MGLKFFAFRFAAACALLAGAAVACAAAAPGDAPAIRLGISTFTESNPNNPVIERTVRELEEKLGPGRITVERFTLPELERAVREGRLDVFLSSSGFYRRMLDAGVKDLATLVSPPFNNPNTQEASAVIVRTDRRDLSSLPDLRGKSVAANLEESFSGYQIGAAEFAKLGSIPEKFFSRQDFVGRDMSRVILRVLSGESDAGILRRCYLEEYAARTPGFSLASVRVLNEKAEQPCRYSTELYPNWSFCATSRSDFRQTRELLAVILAMKPAGDGLYWSIATDFSRVDELMKRLQIGPYRFLRDWGWKEFLAENWGFAASLLLLLAGLAAHSFLTEATVRRRTAELRDALSEQKRLREETERIHTQIHRLQKLGIVGGISSILVHELSQPVAAIRLYVSSVLRQLARGDAPDAAKLTETLSTVRSEVLRVEGIVQRVRSTVKGKEPRHVEVNLAGIVQHAIRLAARARPEKMELVTSLDPAATVIADPVDMEIAVSNLVKNALEAAAESPSPRVSVTLAADPAARLATVEVTDNGPRLSDEAFARLGETFHSTREDGLGLGLGIVRSIAESLGGNLRFRRAEGDGLTAVLLCPLANPKEPHHGHAT